MMRHALSAREAALIGCHSCSLVCSIPAAAGHRRLCCPRCGAGLHTRKPYSLARTWALIITALILYVPANLLPVTVVTSLGQTQSDTIVSGVVYFVQSGAWYLGLIIFVASVAVPMMKILILIYLLISVQRGSRSRLHDRARLYRITETVGRWSMVDVYVVTILVALVKLGGLANIDAGPGAVYFAGVVVVTMFAAMTFDPRLIWDRAQARA